MNPPTPRTNSVLVAGIIQADPSVDLSPFIAMANELTTDVCGALGYTDGYVGSKMELIERWLAAHYYTLYDNQLAAARAGSATTSFQYKVDYGLKSSMYGQNAMRLDTSLALAALDNSANIKRQVTLSIKWVGTHRRHHEDESCETNGDVDFGGEWADLTVEA